MQKNHTQCVFACLESYMTNVQMQIPIHNINKVSYHIHFTFYLPENADPQSSQEYGFSPACVIIYDNCGNAYPITWEEYGFSSVYVYECLYP